MKTLSWIAVIGFLSAFAVLVGLLTREPATPPPATSATPPAPTISPAPVENQAPAAPAPGNLPQGMFKGQDITASELAARASSAFEQGDYETCAHWFALAVQKQPSASNFQGQFHCRLASLKYDEARNVPPQARQELADLAAKAQEHAETVLDAVGMLVLWTSLGERQRLADSFRNLEKAVLASEQLSGGDRQRLRDETESLYRFVLDERNNFDTIRKKIGEMVGM